jgi:hypothetical protein
MMITAETLAVLTTYSPQYLTAAARHAGYNGPVFSSCKFLGITNGGQFCYMAVFRVEGGTDSTKVFLSYDHTEDRVIADYQLTDWA